MRISKTLARTATAAAIALCFSAAALAAPLGSKDAFSPDTVPARTGAPGSDGVIGKADGTLPSPPPKGVPEPMSVALLGLGLAGIGLIRRGGKTALTRRPAGSRDGQR